MIGIKSIASYVPADGVDHYAQDAKFAKDEDFIIGKIGSAFLGVVIDPVCRHVTGDAFYANHCGFPILNSWITPLGPSRER